MASKDNDNRQHKKNIPTKRKEQKKNFLIGNR